MSYLITALVSFVLGAVASFILCRRSIDSGIRKRADAIRTDVAQLKADNDTITDTITGITGTAKGIGDSTQQSIDTAQAIDRGVDEALATLESIRRRNQSISESTTETTKAP